jgi:release factor glutamine methyltransferase
MTAREALREGAAVLAGAETPFLDASLLLAGALGVDRSRILAAGPEELGARALEVYRRSLESRAQGLSVAYILGYKEFWGRRFAVDSRVLVPRPDTETLVEAALRYGDAILQERRLTAENAENAEKTGSKLIREREEGSIASSLRGLRDLRGEPPRLRAHDCCTGSGCVAISLAAERPEWRVSASDISEAALEVASANAAVLLSEPRPGGLLALSSGDLLAGLLDSQAEGRLDLVVANPPYVPSAEAKALLKRGWSEPFSALDGGEEGLEVARRLVAQAARVLAPGGCLLVEADGSQAAALAAVFEAAGFAQVESVADLGGRARVTAGRLPWTA